MMSFTWAMVICLSVYYLSRGGGREFSFVPSMPLCIPPFLFAIHSLSWMDKRTPDQRHLGLRPHKLLQQVVSWPHGHLGLPGHQTDANTTDDDLASGPQPLEQWVMWSLGHKLGEEGFQLRQWMIREIRCKGIYISVEWIKHWEEIIQCSPGKNWYTCIYCPPVHSDIVSPKYTLIQCPSVHSGTMSPKYTLIQCSKSTLLYSVPAVHSDTMSPSTL